MQMNKYRKIDLLSCNTKEIIDYSNFSNDYLDCDIYCHYCNSRLRAILGSDSHFYIIGKHKDDCISELAKIKYIISEEGKSCADNSFLDRYYLHRQTGGGPGGHGGGHGIKNKDIAIVHIQTKNRECINNACKYLRKYNARVEYLDDGTDLKLVFPQLYNFDINKIIFDNTVIGLKCEKKPSNLYMKQKEGYIRLIAKFGIFNEVVVGIYVKMYDAEDQKRFVDDISNRIYLIKEIFIVSNKWEKVKSTDKNVAFYLETTLANKDCYYPIFL